jgi:hypothetical protein
VLYAVEKALDLAHARDSDTASSDDSERLIQVETEIEHLVRLVARLGHPDAHERVLADLERERETLRRRLRRSDPQIDVEELRGPIERTVRDLGAWLTGTPAQGRAALEALLGERRLRVGPDAERGFRIDGELELALELRTARDPQDLRAVRFGGSGGSLRLRGAGPALHDVRARHARGMRSARRARIGQEIGAARRHRTVMVTDETRRRALRASPTPRCEPEDP